ncbi:MAG: 3-deoxy-manno-octulosonate cytidylyltransferase [Acidobacteria bacterium]|nr:3-deoxy-manno-octulosonate cytidylyltransferase [Acidobacteriota bacterium]
MQSARVVAIVPARYGSTRLPGKALAMIDGKPMIQHVHARAAAASRVDAVLVATDDQRIADVVDGFGGVAVMTGAHHPTGTDRLAEVAASLSGDIIVNVQGDEPMIDASAIDACVDALTTHPDDVMSTVRRPLGDDEAENPAVVKVVVDHADVALYFSRASLPHVRYGNATPPRWAHLGLYGYRRTFLLKLASLPPTPLEQAESLEQLRVLEHGYRIRCVKTLSVSVGVDTAEDLERVRDLFARRGVNNE